MILNKKSRRSLSTIGDNHHKGDQLFQIHKKNHISCELHEEMTSKMRTLHKVKSEVWKMNGVAICDGVNCLCNDHKMLMQNSKFDQIKIKVRQPYTYGQHSVLGQALEKFKLPIEYTADGIDTEIKQISDGDFDFKTYAKDNFVQKQFLSRIKTLEIEKNKNNNSEMFELMCKQKELERLQDVFNCILESLKLDPVVHAKCIQLK